MKKGFAVICACFLVVVVGIIGYRWILKPVKIETKKVFDSNLEDVFTSNNYRENSKALSDNPKDYRLIDITDLLYNRSIFKVNSIVGDFLEFDGRYNDRVLSTLDAHGFCAGDEMPDNFCRKRIAGSSIWFYVGDLKNEDEVLDMIYDFVNTCEIEYTYNMQWLGTRKIKYKVKVDREKVEFFDEYEDEEPTILTPEE